MKDLEDPEISPIIAKQRQVAKNRSVPVEEKGYSPILRQINQTPLISGIGLEGIRETEPH